MKLLPAALILLGLTACTTTQTLPPVDTGENVPNPVVDTGPIIVAQPDPTPPPAPVVPPAPPPQPTLPPIVEIYEDPSAFTALPHWQDADHSPALSAFKRGCKSWSKADPNAQLSSKLPEYGTYSDWMFACGQAEFTPETPFHARAFFESEFEPVNLSIKKETKGLLTGYYEPEMQVRRVPNSVYSEPILAKPTSASVLKSPRSKITAKSSRVIAYGKPMEVFFMQIQGSGRIKYADGTMLRAAYAGNNGHKYTSIGRVLIDRGELTKDNASKQAIEEWMQRAGNKKSRELMNKNKRYIFFTEQKITGNDGPMGAMRVPLTELGSIAVDNRYHPYGTLAWLETTIPATGGDYVGVPTGVLVSAQDTGSAIKGPLRGDLFFGSGDSAGELAGVMKHPVSWTILLPVALAMRNISVS